MTFVSVSRKKRYPYIRRQGRFFIHRQSIEYLSMPGYLQSSEANSSWRGHDKSRWNLFRTSTREEAAGPWKESIEARGPIFPLTKRSLPVDVTVIQVNGRYPCVGCCRGVLFRILRNGALASWRQLRKSIDCNFTLNSREFLTLVKNHTIYLTELKENYT